MNKKFLQSPIVYLGNGSLIENAIVILDENGKIENIGQNIAVPKEKIKYYDGALCPGFINTHCHLELSYLKGKINKKTKLNSFIRDVQANRKADQEEIKAALIKADKAMYQSGIVAIGDISNDAFSFETKKNSKILYHNFIELFAIQASAAKQVFDRGLNLQREAAEKGMQASIVPHAPYSVSDLLFQKITTLKNNKPLSIHNQETAAENELFQKGEGKMMDMLIKFGLPKTDFQISKKNSLPSYLTKLPTEIPLLLVHNTYTNREDILFAEKMHPNLYWCFCPNANLYIEDRLPDIQNFIAADVKITLGTDSLASNHQLSILEEMKTLQTAFPQLSTAKLIHWASKNGADFLGYPHLGELKVGKKPGILNLKNLINGKLSQKSNVKRVDKTA